MEKQRIKELALKAGFKTKQQPDGGWDLNPYVYEFAAAIESEVNGDPQPLTETELAFQRFCN